MKHPVFSAMFLLALSWHFLTQQGSIHMIKIAITNFKHNADRPPFDISLAREDLLLMPSSSHDRLL